MEERYDSLQNVATPTRCDRCARAKDDVSYMSTKYDTGNFCYACAAAVMAAARREFGPADDNPAPPHLCPECGSSEVYSLHRLERPTFRCFACSSEFDVDDFGPGARPLNHILETT